MKIFSGAHKCCALFIPVSDWNAGDALVKILRSHSRVALGTPLGVHLPRSDLPKLYCSPFLRQSGGGHTKGVLIELPRNGFTLSTLIVWVFT